MTYSFTEIDKETFKRIGITEEDVQSQLALLHKGPNSAKLDRPATVDDGILKLSNKEINDYALCFESEKKNFSVTRVIPASGLATRMFKFLHFFLDKFSPEKETLRSYLNRNESYKLAVFLGGIEKFPFYKQARKAVKDTHNGTIETDYRYRFINHVVDTFDKLPKALVPFHSYKGSQRTAAEEQLILSKEFMVNKGEMNIHFTVPPSTASMFEQHLSKTIKQLSSTSIKTKLSFSNQKRNTSTVALLKEGVPLRDKDGKLVFRAGGHGSLIGNLNDLKDDIIFLSNIDNITVDRYHEQTARYKKMLAGILISLQSQIFQYSRFLNHGDNVDLTEIKTFLQEKLHVSIPSDLHGDNLIAYVKQKLDRPLRVCGMVKNEGEPGGGPFWVENNNEISLQIVESAQIDVNNRQQKALFEKSTHFNPVDIVCGVYDHNGNKYDLTKFVDYEAYFVAEKSFGDSEIKVLERPGLWNGAMADWNTVFVEVPVRTFNPVKMVNDLLRPMHQSA